MTQQGDKTADSTDVDPGNPPGTDSSIQVGPDPTDPKRERGRGGDDEANERRS